MDYNVQKQCELKNLWQIRNVLLEILQAAFAKQKLLTICLQIFAVAEICVSSPMKVGYLQY